MRTIPKSVCFLSELHLSTFGYGTEFFHILFCESSHKFIGQTRCIGVVKTDGNMPCRILLARVSERNVYLNILRLQTCALLPHHAVAQIYFENRLSLATN